MAVATFDTLKFVRRLEQAGVPSKQAEAQAEVLTEAFKVNLEELVTKEYFESRLDARFAKVSGNFRTLYWILAIIVAATVTPWLERLLSLS